MQKYVLLDSRMIRFVVEIVCNHSIIFILDILGYIIISKDGISTMCIAIDLVSSDVTVCILFANTMFCN